MALPDLLKAVTLANSAGDRSNTTGVAIGESEMVWLVRFHKAIRNQFVHFEPRGWSIEVSGIAEVAKLVARILEDIFRIGWAFRHQERAQREELQQNLQVLRTMQWRARGVLVFPAMNTHMGD
jgi:hypothetical protein